ncbi:MAG: hypothetical protein CMB80_12520 [Flammeovirgaceae bacterium]|nr:hypothetical protein [Flammeovirgaceae bacterium]
MSENPLYFSKQFRYWLKVPVDKADRFEITVDKYGKDAIVKSVNMMQRSHWSKWSKIKKSFILMCSNEMRKELISKAVETDRFILIITSYRQRLLDEDNLTASHKWLIDALRDVRCRFIWDDDPDHMTLYVKQIKATKATGEKPRTLVERVNFDQLNK